jgi:oxaloacetate decarboxylase
MTDFNALLQGPDTTVMASVFNPISVAMASELGFQAAMVGGSVIAANHMAMPDYGLMTLSELVDNVRRIASVASIPIVVDGDSGYGNTHNCWRLVRELEAAGSSAVTIEDYVLPRPAGQRTELCDLQEQLDRLRAALEARSSSHFGVIARTRVGGNVSFDECLRRVAGYAGLPVAAVCVFGQLHPRQAAQLAQACGKPLMLINYQQQRGEIPALASAGVRLLLSGHQAFEQSLMAMYQSYASSQGIVLSESSGWAAVRQFAAYRYPIPG